MIYVSIIEGPDMILPLPDEIPHPRESFIATLLMDLEILDLDATDTEVGDLELHCDRNSLVFIPLFTFY